MCVIRLCLFLHLTLCNSVSTTVLLCFTTLAKSTHCELDEALNADFYNDVLGRDDIFYG